MFSSRWDTDIYASYDNTIIHHHIVFIDFYSDVSNRSKSGTQGLTFLPVRFANLKPHTEKWHTVGLAPIAPLIAATLPDETRRKLNLQLLQRFTVMMFRSTIKWFYTSFVVHSAKYYPRFGIFVADQPEER